MLPLGLLNAAQGHPMLVELKNGETLNGHLVSCDTWMNLTLKEVVQTSPEGDRFVRLPEVYVKGNNSASHRRANRAVSEEDEEASQEEITADEEAIVDGAVVVEAVAGVEVNKMATMIGDDTLRI
ncbi:hypothetical protein FSARC_6072 [Fusarium sarcochroum]|uniref:LSM complex subunit LSM4 n=1 Tax=Fusarium sarcochroum TaxID=1208366 RepID=A0A8H4TYA7_9HYPO|nr:hypothetical protein FSARC_6072 [Fusarium sarcochroum]